MRCISNVVDPTRSRTVRFTLGEPSCPAEVLKREYYVKPVRRLGSNLAGLVPVGGMRVTKAAVLYSLAEIRPNIRA